MQFNATVHLPRGRMVAMSGNPEDLKTIAGILAAVADGHTDLGLDHPEYPGATVADITEIDLEVLVR
jgi:hypothetical protein